MSLFLWALSHRSTLGSRFWSDVHTLTFSHTLGSEYSTLHPLHLALKLGLKPGSHLVWKANKVTASFQNPHPYFKLARGLLLDVIFWQAPELLSPTQREHPQSLNFRGKQIRRQSKTEAWKSEKNP